MENFTFMWVSLIIQVSLMGQDSFITLVNLKVNQIHHFLLKQNLLMDPFLPKILSLFSKTHHFIVEDSQKAPSMEKDT